MRGKRILSILLILTMLLSLYLAIPADAASTRKVYFDNYYTQFDEVYVGGYTKVTSEWKSYPMENIGNGILCAEVSSNLGWIECHAKGGYANYPYRFYDDRYEFYLMCRKTPSFSYGDIRHVHRIYASN